jgi:hypothetical protein
LAAGDPYQVGAGDRWPEWAISVYDYKDASGTLRRPRPVRLGVPVISTVATEGDWTHNAKADYQGTSTDNLEPQEKFDIEQTRTGRAARSRRIYFLAVCDNDINDQTPSLLIHMPSGIDTVRYTPETVSLQKYKGSARQWWGYYDFHQEDGQEFVDGYCYLSVALPMSVVRPLPLRLRYKATGFSSGDSGLDDPDSLQQAAWQQDAASLLSISPATTDRVRVGLKDAGPKYQGTPPHPVEEGGGCGCRSR